MKIRRAAALLLVVMATFVAPVITQHFQASQTNPSLRADGVSPPPTKPLAA